MAGELVLALPDECRHLVLPDSDYFAHWSYSIGISQKEELSVTTILNSQRRAAQMLLFLQRP